MVFSQRTSDRCLFVESLIVMIYTVFEVEQTLKFKDINEVICLVGNYF